MDAVLASTIDLLEDVVKPPDSDSQSEVAFAETRHTEPVQGSLPVDSSWRLKERVKTVSVALVLCLNVGVDPPDLVKTEPCANLECWFDPQSEEPQKAIEDISVNLEKQYEQWQSRARFKKSLDPTVEEVKRLCSSLRRFSKEDRILFHYNGHGVPRPTRNGEIWVFNEKFTEYMPLSIYELQQCMGAPAIYVFDCSCAGSIVNSFLEFAKQRWQDYELNLLKYTGQKQQRILVSNTSSNNNNNGENINYNNSNDKIVINQKQHNNGKRDFSANIPQDSYVGSDVGVRKRKVVQDNCGDTTNNMINNNNNINNNILEPPVKPPDHQNCFHLAACEANQILPMQPDLPADLFTSCLTTPIKMALRWFIQKNDMRLMPKINLSLVDKIPGNLGDRRTMLGELNWIFTAITDTIAWDVLPRDVFQRLYRQDLLVASLFRNFLLADRIMRFYQCTPVSHPKLPKTYHHQMWRAWDMVVDLCLTQLVDVLEDRQPFKTSTFFAEQLTAFEVWLDLDHSGSNQQFDHLLLPIILQVLLSPVHRLRALDLLSRFLNLGPGAVNSALSVGIFPYVLKLLQSNAREVRPFLLSIWAKILAIDRKCQVDLVPVEPRYQNHRYFLTILSDTSYDARYRTMAAFVMCCIVRDYPLGQEVAYQSNLIAFCLEQLEDPDPQLRKWLAICLGTTWDNYEDARWCGVRSCAHEKLYTLLDDPEPEVRAAAVFALGTFINSSSERSDHANTIDHSIGVKLASTSLYDSSYLVRYELLVSLQYLVLAFETQFYKLEQAALEEERKLFGGGCIDSKPVAGGTPPTCIGSCPRAGGAPINCNGFLSPTMQIGKSSANTPMKTGSGANNSSSLTPTTSTGACMLPRINSLNAIPLLFGSNTKIVSNVYQNIWKAMYTLASDPHPKIAYASQMVIDEIRSRSLTGLSIESLKESKSNSSNSESSSPNTNTPATFSISESPPTSSAGNSYPKQFAGESTASNSNSNTTVLSTLTGTLSSINFGGQQHQQPNKLSPSNANNPNIRNFYAQQQPPSPPQLSNHLLNQQQQHHGPSAANSIEQITRSVAGQPPSGARSSSRRYGSYTGHGSIAAASASEDESRSNMSSTHKPLLTSSYIDWCSKFLVSPNGDFTSSSKSATQMHQAQINIKDEQHHEWRMLRVRSYRKVCLNELMCIDPIRFNESIQNFKIQQVPNLVAVHPYDPIMVVAGREKFCIMQLDNQFGTNPNSSGGNSDQSTTTTTTATATVQCNPSNTMAGSNTNASSHSDLSNMASPSSMAGVQLIGGRGHRNHHMSNGTGGMHHISNCITTTYTNHLRAAGLATTSTNDLNQHHHQQHQQHQQHHHHHHHNQNHNNVNHHQHQHLNNYLESSSQVTSLQLINPQYNTLISTGSSDGSVRIWRAYNSSQIDGIPIDLHQQQQQGYSLDTPRLVSAFHLMPELMPTRHGLGMILLWDQMYGRFYATSDQSDVRIIKVWDAASESKILDIPTCAEFGVSCLSSDGENSIAAGFLDGSIRIYDTRLKRTDCRTNTFRKHSEKILDLHMYKPGEKHINLISGDINGEVRFWDKRAPTSVKRLDIGSKMGVMTVHPNADVFACGLKSSQGIRIYNLDGSARDSCLIKNQDGTFFSSGSRHNPSVNCLAFHPLKTSLVAGYSDSVISIHSARNVI